MRLQDVATIYTDPRYMFDECLAFLGQQHIALPGYSTIQTLITRALAVERERTEQILSQHMSAETIHRLQAIMKDKSLFSYLSGIKGECPQFFTVRA